MVKTRANDGSDRPPSLVIHQAMWAMECYGDKGKEWSLEEKLERTAEAGFAGIYGRLPDAADEQIWRSLLHKHKLSFGLESFPENASELASLLERASDYPVLYVNAQVPGAFTIGQEAHDRLLSLMETADRYEVPLFIETHRGKITQDLLRTVEYAAALPDLRLTIDFSHYVVAGEMYNFDEADPYLNTLLQRTSSIHGRVTNAEQIQIDAGPDGSHPMVAHFSAWWERGMSYWMDGAQQGDVLPFVSEIGRHYAVTANYVPGYSWEEHFDRWQQSLVMKRLAEEAWSKAQMNVR